MIRKKTLIGAGSLALTLAAATALASIPVTEAPVIRKAPLKSVRLSELTKPVKASRANKNSFFEGFEDRPDGIYGKNQSWLPEGWKEISKSGHGDVPDNSAWNLTWQVTTNEDVSTCAPVNETHSFEGEAFAFIMCDVAWGDKVTLDEQDEWLISPQMTPGSEDWLYFKLIYSPSWTVYNRDKGDFSGQNSSLEVYISEDDGENWTKAWSLIDDEIRAKFSDEELREDLSVSPSEYRPIYVDITPYRGKDIKFAFRYFGKAGLPIAIDNVSVGVPQPVSEYILPGQLFYQGISPTVEYPANPTILIPQETELFWENISTDVLHSKWTYADASGETATSESEHLSTPGYPYLSQVATPSLQGFFESRESVPFQSEYARMQAGGFISGSDDQNTYTGEFGVGYTDVFDGKIVLSSEYMSLNPETDLAWEKIQGYLDGTLDVLGFCSLYRKPEVPYGFDYIDVTAIVRETVPETDGLMVSVYPVSEDGILGEPLGQSRLGGADIPKANTSAYVNLRFNFPMPILAEESILVVISGCREGGNVSFPYIASMNDNKRGNNLVYWIHYDYDFEEGFYEEFKNLATFPAVASGHFAGFLMSLGASYSHLDIVGNKTFDINHETENTLKLNIDALHGPERWVLTADGKNADDRITIDTELDDATGNYIATLNVPAGYMGDKETMDLRLCSPGSSDVITFRKDMSGVNGTIADSGISVRKVAGGIIVGGATSSVEIFDVTGKLIVSKNASGSVSVSLDEYSAGIYIVRVDGKKTFKVAL